MFSVPMLINNFILLHTLCITVLKPWFQSMSLCVPMVYNKKCVDRVSLLFVTLCFHFLIFFMVLFHSVSWTFRIEKMMLCTEKSMHGHNSDFSNIWVQQGVMQHSVQCWIDCKTISFDAFLKGEKKHKTALQIKAALFYTNSQIESSLFSFPLFFHTTNTFSLFIGFF